MAKLVPWVGYAAAAAFLGLSRQTVRTLVQHGVLERWAVGRRVGVTWESVERVAFLRRILLRGVRRRRRA